MPPSPRLCSLNEGDVRLPDTARQFRCLAVRDAELLDYVKLLLRRLCSAVLRRLFTISTSSSFVKCNLIFVDFHCI